MQTLFLCIFPVFLISLVGCQVNKTDALISQIFPTSGSELSAWGWVGVRFSEPVDQASVEAAFSITPTIKGTFIWEENTFWFRPLAPFSTDITYQALLSGDLLTAELVSISVDQTWDFSIRKPSLVFTANGEVWRANLDGEDQIKLSQSDGHVIEFSLERSGEWIAFITSNISGGHDLWTVDRNGENQRLLVDCEQDQCAEPAWSMDRKTIAYTRETFQTSTNGYRPAQIWTVDVESGETSQLYQSDIAFGHAPSFSPDGKKFASYDTTQNGIRILDLETSQESIVPRFLPGVGDWSQDGKKMLFTDVIAAENEPFVQVYIVDLNSNEVVPAFGKEITDTDFSQPRWMPDEEWIAASLRPVNSNANKALWAIRLKDAFSIPISDDLSATYSSYQWGPWGNQLVHQRLALTSSDPSTSIWLWDWETRQSRLIIENAARPAWLP